MGVEGIVSKRLGSRYRSGRSPDWLKFKNPEAPAVKREAEEGWGRGLNERGSVVLSDFIVDEDRRQFTVEGPLCDASAWSRAIDKARKDGRKVKCCDIGSTTRADAIAEWQRHYGLFYRLVEQGNIVSPQTERRRRHELKETETMKPVHGAQYEISIDGVPRTYRDRQDIALQAARF